MEKSMKKQIGQIAQNRIEAYMDGGLEAVVAKLVKKELDKARAKAKTKKTMTSKNATADKAETSSTGPAETR